MRCLRMAWNLATSEAERLVYEGWLLYDMGYVEETLTKAEEAISIQRSFEAFFLKAYALADKNLDADEVSCVVQVLEEALKCPSDGLRKGQVGILISRLSLSLIHTVISLIFLLCFCRL